jgi:hypothetical protein
VNSSEFFPCLHGVGRHKPSRAIENVGNNGGPGLNEDARYCGFSNPSTHSAHSEDDVVDEMLQLNEQIRFDSRAVGQTARVEVRPER